MATKLAQTSEIQPVLKEDITIMIGGQGGDGTLTVVNLLGRVFRDLGLNIYDARNVLSRIRGGHADGVIRGSTRDLYCIGDSVDILVAFDEEAVQAGISELGEKPIILFDSSKGQLSEKFRKPNFSIFGVPMGNMAASELRRNIFKNTIAFAILGRLLGLEDEVLVKVLTSRYQRRGKEALEANLKALQMGFEFATKNIPSNPYTLARGKYADRILSTGNEAAAFGFLASGGRFFIGYPITPATDIMER